MIADIFEIMTRVAEKQHWFSVFHTCDAPFDMIIGMAVAEQQIYVAVIVKIEKFQPPATKKLRRPANACGNRHIFEALILIIVVKGEHLLVHVCDEEIRPAILIVIGRVHAHARPWPAVRAEADARE